MRDRTTVLAATETSAANAGIFFPQPNIETRGEIKCAGTCYSGAGRAPQLLAPSPPSSVLQPRSAAGSAAS